jgi:hypothetical protein
VQRTSLQPPAPPLAGPDAIVAREDASYTIQVDPPGPQRLFRLDTESELLERVRQTGRQLRQQDADVFPVEEPVATEPYPGRYWPESFKYAEPGYVCYQRLLFEQRNYERWGWDLGIVTPFTSLGEFFFDFVTLPYHVASRPHCKADCSSGYCLPGDPVPFLLYPPEISATGTLAEAAVVAAMFAIFP